MIRSPMKHLAAVSHALHFGAKANPQGNTEPAAVTLIYNPETGSYETPQQYTARIDKDAEVAAETIDHETGTHPRVMIWPYGAYNKTAIAAEARHGMAITMTLDDGYGNAADLSAIPRYLVKDDPEIGAFAADMRHYTSQSPLRVVQVDLDYLYDDNPEQLNKNMDTLINRVHDMGITTVFLQAFADPTGSEVARQVYFPNRVLPMRADLFNRAARQLATRAHVRVYGWLPVLSFDFGDRATQVMAWDAKTGIRSFSGCCRCSPRLRACRGLCSNGGQRARCGALRIGGSNDGTG